MDRFCLDANILIQAKNGLYSFDLLPSFWVWLEDQLRKGRIYTIQPVYDEWNQQEDELTDWIRDRKELGLCLIPSEIVQKEFERIANYIQLNYRAAHARDFLAGADAWVIAQATADGSIVVTEEQPVDSSSSKIKIPNICQEFDTQYCSTLQMLKDLGFKA